MSKTRTVLALDDEPVNLEILEEHLADEFDFVGVTCGEDALRILGQRRVDVVLLDVRMPGMDGYEVCRRIRERDGLGHVKILFLSGKALPSERVAGYRAGGDDYVVKPFDGEELRSKVRVFSRLCVAEELERAKDSILSLLSHSIRTPLNGLLPAAELLNADHHSLTEDTRADLVDTIYESALDLARVVERSLLWCELRSGSTQLRREDVDVEHVVEQAVLGARVPAGVRLDHEVEADFGVRSDAGILQEALTGLIEGCVAQADADHLSLRVSSTVAGMQFELEFDRNTASSLVFDVMQPVVRGGCVIGADMALALSRELIEALGAEWSIETDGPRSRVTFLVAERLASV